MLDEFIEWINFPGVVEVVDRIEILIQRPKVIDPSLGSITRRSALQQLYKQLHRD